MLFLKLMLSSAIILKATECGGKPNKPTDNFGIPIAQNRPDFRAQEFKNNALQLPNARLVRLEDYKKIYDTAIGKYCKAINIDMVPKIANIGMYGAYPRNTFNMKQPTMAPRQDNCLDSISVEWNGDFNVHYKKIESGGFGEIYRGTKPFTKDTIIVKMMKASLTHEDKYLIEKGIDEAYFGLNFKSLFPNDNINVVSYYRCCTEIITKSHSVEYAFYYVMDEYKFGSLRSLLANNNYFTTRTNIEWKYKVIYKILKAVEKLHHNQIIHRDIKPGNILMKSIDDPYLSDFGTIKLSNIAKTAIGTPVYEAPEIGNRVYDSKVDIYALGIVIFEILNSGFYFRKTYHNDIYNYCNQKDVGPSYDRWGNFVGYPFRYPKYSIEDNESILYCSYHEKLIKRMMDRNPGLRPTITEVITHFRAQVGIDYDFYVKMNEHIQVHGKLYVVDDKLDDEREKGFKTRAYEYLNHNVILPIKEKIISMWQDFIKI